jgi:hypothetical protein
MDLTVVAYATLALSLFVSAFKIGGWILNADPRTIVNAGRWTLAGLPLVALGVLVWLAATGHWTAATFLTAFLLPVLVQTLPRWRVLLPSHHPLDGGIRPFATDLGGSVVPHGSARAQSSPELVAQSIAALRDYLEQSRALEHGRPQIAHGPSSAHHRVTPQNGSGNGRPHMSTQEAFAVLGLAPTPSPREIKAAHHRLEQMLDPEHGGSHYLLMKINEARDVLLGE